MDYWITRISWPFVPILLMVWGLLCTALLIRISDFAEWSVAPMILAMLGGLVIVTLLVCGILPAFPSQ